MALAPVMARLRAAANPGAARTYARHGAADECLGVSYAELNKLARSVGTDHATARSLWGTGIHEARVLATKVADPAATDRAELEAWMSGTRDHIIKGALAGFVARTPHAHDLAKDWIERAGEVPAAAGWNVYAALAMSGQLDERQARALIARIVENIHDAQNRVRYAMNNALIAMGGGMPAVRLLAITAARAIGHVEVDHGDTSCKTPDAVSYIQTMAARQAIAPVRRTGGKKSVA